jgi:hypothetical protein
MSTTVVLVSAGHNHLRYLVTYSGSGPGTIADITTTGAASPDLLTDSLNGPIRECAEAFTDGIGILPAGALTQAQARAIWMADNSDVVLGNAKVPRAICSAVAREVFGTQFSVDANVDGGGHPVIHISELNTTVGAWSGYIDVEMQGPIGL